MLKQKAKSAVMWSAMDLLLRQGLSLVVQVILARLLVPEDFGTIALLSLFTGVAQLFVNAGFSAALIQRQDVTHTDESTVFWFNIGAGLFVSGVLILLSPLIADFFSLPVLKLLTILMACNVSVSALGAIHTTLLSKRLDFKTPMKIGVFSTLISGGVGVSMALGGYGVWSLAAQVLTASTVGTALLWYFNQWRPIFVFDRGSFRRLFGFSGYIFASGMLETVYQRGYTILLGKFYGTFDLGIYNRADNVQQLPANVIGGLLSRVAFPLFSSINKDKDRLRFGMRLSVRTLMLVTAPIMIGLAVLAELVIGVVFGEQWLKAAPVLQVLCITGLFFPLQLINLDVLQAQGHANLFFRLEVIKKTSGMTLLVIGCFFGMLGIAWSRVLQSCIALIINAHYTKKYLDYGVWTQLRDCLPSIMLAGVMAVVVRFADTFLNAGVLQLPVLFILGAVIYLAVNWISGAGAYREAVGFVKGEAMI